MKIKIATMTGPNDNTSVDALNVLSGRFPFVEWGVLVSESQQGNSPRFPTPTWIKRFLHDSEPAMQRSAHICGAWVRSICRGYWALPSTIEWVKFQRIQLNFHAVAHTRTPVFYALLFKKSNSLNRLQEAEHQFILQLDGVNDAVVQECLDYGINAVPIFDLSGGAGIVPAEWPKPIPNCLCTYAGGLGPHNLREQLLRIQDVVGDAVVAVDMETHIRSSDDHFFDLVKVENCLEIVKEFV